MKETIHLKFNSLSAFAEYIDTHPQVVGSDASKMYPTKQSWALGMPYKEADRILRTGGYWKEGADLVRQRVFEYEQSMNMGLGPSTDYDVAGFMPDVSEYVKGSPTPMIAEKDDGLLIASKPIVRIGVNTAMLCDVDAKYALNRGAAVASLVDFLESRGQRCEVWALARMRDGWCKDVPDLNVDVMVKPSHVQWDPGSIAFTLAHPAWFRRLIFRVIESRQEWEKPASEGYGQTAAIIHDLDEWDIYFGSLSRWGDSVSQESVTHYETIKAAVDHIQKTAEKIRGGQE